MDARKMKLVVVDDDLNIILGQPYIMMLKDKATRSIIGFYLYFGGESADAAIRGVIQSIFPKHQFNRKYPALRTAWLPFGLPEFILLDAGRGFVSDRFEELSFVLGFHFGTTKVRAPWLKGAVESAFSYVKSGFESGLPGEVKANIRFESEYKHYEGACIRFSKLKELLTRWIVDVHNNSVAEDDGKSANDRVIELTKKRRPYLPKNALSVMEYMGTKRTGTISPVKGIKLLGSWYNSEDLQAMGRHLIRTQGNRKVEFFTNDNDLGAIRVINPDNNTRLQVFAKRYDILSGKSLKFIIKVRKHIREKLKKHPSQKLVKEVSVEIHKEALAEMERLKHKSKKSGKTEKPTSISKEVLLDKAMKDAEQDDESFKNDLIESFGFDKALTPQVQQFPEPLVDKKTGEIFDEMPDSLIDELLEDDDNEEVDDDDEEII